MANIQGEIEFLHVYSHQDTAIKHKDEERLKKIEKQRSEYENDKFYDILVKGNEQADIIADIGRQDPDIERDWARSPTEHTDSFYLSIGNGNWIDEPIHQWVKRDTQKRFTKEAIASDAKRATHRTEDTLFDKRLSYISESRNTPMLHKRYTFLFKLRMHSKQEGNYKTWINISISRSAPLQRLLQKSVSNATLRSMCRGRQEELST